MMFAPYVPLVDPRHQTPQQRKRANRFALGLFVLTALAGLFVKFLL